MDLFADRFIVEADACDGSEPPGWMRAERSRPSGERVQPARDLASGAAVTLVHSSAGGATDVRQWSTRCSRLAVLHHPHMARLLDFGLVGEGRRFEAWSGGLSWCGDAQRLDHARRATDAFLAENDLTATRPDALVVSRGGRPLVVPDGRAGLETSAPDVVREPGDPALACGVHTIGRAAVSAVTELVTDLRVGAAPRPPAAVALWGEAGSGLTTAVHAIARAARTQGLVPVEAGAADPRVWDALRGRSVLVIDRNEAGAGWWRLLERCGHAGCMHLLLLVASQPVSGVHSLRLAPVPPELLLDAVRPHTWLARHRRSAERAARHAHGLPARFAAALWGTAAHAVSQAAEDAPAYGGQIPAGVVAARPPRAWPVSGDVAALRERATRAARAVDVGRHVTGTRDLRTTVAALARRRDWGSCASGTLALAASAIGRGKVPEARRLIAEAVQFAERGGDSGVVRVATVLRADLSVDEGLLQEAEATARGALAAAAAAGDVACRVAAAAVLSRALFWQARYAEAADVVDAEGERATTDRERAVLAVARARAAVGLSPAGDLPVAVTRAMEAAERVGAPAGLSRAHAVLALARLRAGDLRQASADGRRAVAYACAAGDARAAMSARLVATDAERQAGQAGPALRLLARLSRGRLPAILQARATLLRELVRGADPDTSADRLVAATGLRALALFAPRAGARAAAEPRAEEVLALITRLQAADDDLAALTGVCAALRGQLQAAAVGCVVRDGGALTMAAADGGRLGLDTAVRAIQVEQPVRAQPDSGGAEAAAPIRFGGVTLGALAVRWPAGAPMRVERVDALLALASALVAPASAACARRPAPGLADEIVGISDRIEHVRQAVDRAAPVPYPVLIEGESGSGKELVARALHRRSPRRDRPFVAVNCAAIPDDLLESELFGHAKGAFTGALAERAGVFEAAHGGTLFLDEVGELTPRAQAKLLRTLQESEVRRVGESVARRVDVRVVAATNRDLRQEVAAGRFRLDLLYRLDVVRIPVPALRDRMADLPLLAERFWHEAAERVRSRAVLGPATRAALAQHHWPGNVRELQNVMAALAVRAPKRGIVPPSALPWGGAARAAPAQRLDQARRAFEIQFVRAALVRAGGQRGRAAAELGLSRQGFSKVLSRLGLAVDGVGQGEIACPDHQSP